MTRSHLAALLALALPLTVACTATETTPDAADSASAAPEATMTTPAPDATRTPEATATASDPEADSCNASKVRARWTGALPSDDVKAEIAKAVGERRIRYYTEGDPITMDYSEQRLNVVLGEDGRIKEFSCG